ncbi:hypothetical protein KBC04_03035 [Candidatus Babeliales bacterium]|nr:hypothetical protein [Candidatus Babeliales bacterium]MBP9843973.1 hypothetical protein [Candidatus Babeliales bacterium]
MKLNSMVLSLLLVGSLLVVAHDHHEVAEKVQQIVQVTKCSCGPVEHVFYKICVKNYNKLFVDAGLFENNDYEGLSENIVSAIEMLAQTINFVKKNGNVIVPKLNKHGKLYLPLTKNPDYVLCKEILGQVDLSTTLSAEELFQAWLERLEAMKSAQ